ncbi:BamA/TamA family outer membrane protein [Celeribacter indicus]|uniref:Outer membrane assembly factor n=1 Tax=Celeribacter indicus TaxID=1208324 RepID=A0A0B5E952_9RHOB|nr:BamA/TamA family outer membrane protein [Celeribacter indicus]AJE48852.1 outer membrane assembly factor [Celeribacter indicus]SDW39158.1 outer membrane protein insertion porin family [Celeribacter indicus]
MLPHISRPHRVRSGNAGTRLRRTALFLTCLCLAQGAASQAALRSYSAVEVRGAEFIPEDDIRMTCGAQAGVPYLDLELRAIEECLMSTGVFETVALSAEGDVLVISVKELNTRPGRIEASLAYASEDGLIASLFFERYNLFPGTYGSLKLDYNPEVKRATSRFYRAEFRENLDLGLDLGYGELSFDDLSYTHENKQIEAYLVWTPRENLRLTGGIGYRDHSQTGIEADASPLIAREEISGLDAPFLHLGVAHASFSETEDRWHAVGYSVSFDQYFWNLGTEDEIFDSRLETRSYVPLGDRWRMLISVSAGTVDGAGDNDTRAVDRFFPAADRFRGFAPRGVGPRDGDDPLGGNTFAVSSFEVQRRFDDVFNAPLVAGAFVDTGASWGLDDTLGGTVDDRRYRRTSVGLSVSFDVGSAPVSLYVAEPVEQEDGDDEQIFGLSVRTAF